MTTVEVYGWGTDLSVTPISEEIFQEITSASVTEERLMDIEAEFWNDRRVWTGFAVDPDFFQVLVDGKPVARDVLDSFQVQFSPHQLMPKGVSYLVVDEAQKGNWVTAKSRKKFRPELVLIDPDTIILSSGERYPLLALYFDGKGDFGHTVGKVRDVFAVSSLGERLPINLTD